MEQRNVGLDGGLPGARAQPRGKFGGPGRRPRHWQGQVRNAFAETIPGRSRVATLAYFLAITGFIFAAVQVAGGILFLILGLPRGPVGGGVIFTGLMFFVGAAVTAAGAAPLMTYASRLGDLATAATRAFWKRL